MSISLLRLVFECEGYLTANEDHILLYIANKVNEGEGNEAWCTQDYLSKKSRLSPSTVMRTCNSLRDKGIIFWVHKHRHNNKFKRNHYRINYNSLIAMINKKEVSQRTTPVSQADGQVTVTVTNNNLTNNLNNNLNAIDKFYEENKNQLKPEERTSAHHLTINYKDEDQSLEYDYVYKYLVVWIKSNKTQELWDSFKNGLPSPIEKGWTKVLPRTLING